MFEEHFRPYAERGDEVLYICFSTGIAGTFQAANLAYNEVLEEYPDFKLTIIDSKCASVGYGLVVERILRMQRNGAPKELIIEAAQFFCDHMEHAVTVQQLDYLFKGGRLSKTSFLAGTVLDIKPIIIVDEQGSLKAVEKVRGWKKAQKRILDMVGEKGKNLENQRIGVCYGTDEAAFSFLKEQLQERYHVKEILEEQVGCAIGAHTGPGILGIVFLNETNEAYEKYLV
jgi:DegV family protein with EDD domain